MKGLFVPCPVTLPKELVFKEGPHFPLSIFLLKTSGPAGKYASANIACHLVHGHSAS